MFVCMYVCMDVSMYLCTHTHIYINIYINKNMYMYIHTCLFTKIAWKHHSDHSTTGNSPLRLFFYLKIEVIASIDQD